MKKILRARFTVTPTRWICHQCRRFFGGEKPCPHCYRDMNTQPAAGTTTQGEMK